MEIKIFILILSINSIAGRRPFVDPTFMRSKIYDEYAPYYAKAVNRFNQLDDETAMSLNKEINIFPDTLIAVKMDFFKKFQPLPCASCKVAYRKFEDDLNVNYEVLREEYSFERIRIRFESTFLDVASRILTPVKDYVAELRDYKSNYKSTATCWDLHKSKLFDILDHAHSNARNDLDEVSKTFKKDCELISETFANETAKANKEADECNHYSRGFGFCYFLYYEDYYPSFRESLMKTRRHLFDRIEDLFHSYDAQLSAKVISAKKDLVKLSEDMDACLEKDEKSE